MADANHIHEFAVKWCDKFKDQNINYTELVGHCMVDDCAKLGFEMDCGQAFSEKYGDAGKNIESLDRIIDEVDDIALLGSAIYSRWRHFTHLAYSAEQILEAENRAWFITAFSRLEKLTSTKDSGAGNIILFPNFAALKNEVEKLRTEMSMLLLEHDEILHVECKNIEMAYILAVGNLEYKAYELQCAVLRLKRKTELIQAKKNRQEMIIVSAIEAILDDEFAEYQAQLDEQINKMNAALERNKGEFLSDEETRELKKLYRLVVKSLHPDLNPNISDAKLTLFHNAVSAYKNGDLNSLRIISTMVSEPILPEQNEDSMTVLMKEKERLANLLNILRGKIEKIKNDYPYIMKSIIQSEEKIAEKKAELESIITQWNEVLEFYQAKIAEMLR